jgi:hypothetical protein
MAAEHEDESWTRGDWARWFVEHDDVGEAARVLQPGDELSLGQSDYVALADALERRGLRTRYEHRRVTVLPADVKAGARKPPLRAAAAPAAAARKKTA